MDGSLLAQSWKQRGMQCPEWLQQLASAATQFQRLPAEQERGNLLDRLWLDYLAAVYNTAARAAISIRQPNKGWPGLSRHMHHSTSLLQDLPRIQRVISAVMADGRPYDQPISTMNEKLLAAAHAHKPPSPQDSSGVCDISAALDAASRTPIPLSARQLATVTPGGGGAGRSGAHGAPILGLMDRCNGVMRTGMRIVRFVALILSAILLSLGSCAGGWMVSRCPFFLLQCQNQVASHGGLGSTTRSTAAVDNHTTSAKSVAWQLWRRQLQSAAPALGPRVHCRDQFS